MHRIFKHLNNFKSQVNLLILLLNIELSTEIYIIIITISFINY